MTQQITLAKAALPVLRERRVIGNLSIQTEWAEPSVRQIEVNLIAEPPLGPDAHAVADDQHPDHQLRVNRENRQRKCARRRIRFAWSKGDER